MSAPHWGVSLGQSPSGEWDEDGVLGPCRAQGGAGAGEQQGLHRRDGEGGKATPPSLCFLLAGLVFVFPRAFSIQPLWSHPGPPASSRLLPVAVTRQTFLVVTAGLGELGSSPEGF